MSGASKKLMGTTAAGGDLLAIEDVFSTYLYTGGISGGQTITNGIDLAGEGGLVWIKGRNYAYWHQLADTERGVNKMLSTNSTNAESTRTQHLTAFNSDGFSVGTDNDVNFDVANVDPDGTYASWTFRKAPRFFDVVTYTGTGSSQVINHNLGCDIGFVVIKRTDGVGNWVATHKDVGSGAFKISGFLNGTDSFAYGYLSNFTQNSFTVYSTSSDANASGATYVAYLFAHDPLGPSGDGSDGLIACGTWTGDSNGRATINLGWEPQWVLFKATNLEDSWYLADTMRGFGAFSPFRDLNPNTFDAEGNAFNLQVTPTGFTTNFGGATTYIYIAIRRGPMRQPTSGTEVFAVTTQGAVDNVAPGFKTDWPVDFGFRRGTSASNWLTGSRLTGSGRMYFDDTGGEGSDPDMDWDFNNGWWGNATTDATKYGWLFRRAPGFFDVVAYTGNSNGSTPTQTVNHTLGAKPELVIVKSRGSSQNWYVFHKDVWDSVNNNYLRLNLTSQAGVGDGSIFPSDTTDTTFTVSERWEVNQSGVNYIAYLFATLPGVSKVGIFTTSGSNINVDCGFTSGARFVMFKRSDSTGNWFVLDTARGIVSGADPYLLLNTTDTENAFGPINLIEPYSAGFTVNAANFANGNWIFLAIA